MPLKTVSPMANVDQQQAELLALEIINSSAVSMARTRARTLMARHPIALTLDGATQLDYSLDKWVSQLALQDVGRDLSTPRIIWSTTVAPYAWMGHAFPGSAAAIDCPDNIYRNVALAGSTAYEVVGKVSNNGPAQFSFHLTNHPEEKGFDTTDDMTDVGGYDMITNENIVLDDDGGFRISLDNQPANGRLNHIQMPAEKVLYLLVRDTLSNWQQTPNQLSIRRVGGDALPQPQTKQELIARTAGHLEQFVAFWLRFNDHFHKPAANVLGPAYPRNGGLGYASAGQFSLNDDEILLITISDGDADYVGMQITNPWMIGPSPKSYLSSYNMAQTLANADGSLTYLIAHSDPGYGNWVDTAGLKEGWIFFRWQGVKKGTDGSELIVEQRVLHSSALPLNLPEIGVAQRESQLANRQSTWDLRIETGI